MPRSYWDQEAVPPFRVVCSISISSFKVFGAYRELHRLLLPSIRVACPLQVQMLLQQSGALDLSKLTIGPGRACWVAYLDIYILDADGSLLDACMLGAVAALSGFKTLPQVTVDDSGVILLALSRFLISLFEASIMAYFKSEIHIEALPCCSFDVHSKCLGQYFGLSSCFDRQAILSRADPMDSAEALAGFVNPDRMPVSLTCGFYGDSLSADLTAEEEQLMDCTVTVTVDAAGRLIGTLPASQNVN